MPPFLLGLAIVFWGWHTGFLTLSLGLAGGVEVGQWNRRPWALEEADFRRMTNLCVVLLLILMGSLVISQQWMQGIYRFLQWLPIIFVPLLLAQVYSTQDQIPLRSLFLVFAQDPKLKDKTIDLRHPYFATCLLAASAVQEMESSHLGFYGGMVLLGGAYLWTQRKQRSLERLGGTRWSPWISLTCFLFAATVGFGGQEMLHQLHVSLEEKAIQWLSDLITTDLDPLKRNTAIGEVGSLKLSNDILFRVSGKTVPALLRQATYNKYQGGIWIATDALFLPVPTDDTATQWDLRPPEQRSSISDERLESLTITDTFPDQRGLLKLPQTAQRIQEFPASGMERNQYGTVRAESESNGVTYQVQFLPEVFDQNYGGNLDQPPVEADLAIPEAEKAMLYQILREITFDPFSPNTIAAEVYPLNALNALNAQELVNRLQTLFANEFQYSLDLISPLNQATALNDFLGNHRSGHCEYFATAMTLLLRAAGIPARYAVGFAVHEFSRLEQQYLVRGRHAHAWTIAYLSNHWVALDPTPSDWRTEEAARVPLWSKAKDVVAWGQFALVRGFQTFARSPWLRRWWWLGIPVILFYLRQLNNRQRIQAVRPVNPKITPSPAYPGMDSDFYAIEKRLQEQGWPRNSSETLKQWIDRLEHQFPEAENWPKLHTALVQHYQRRFDPLRPGEISRPVS